MGETLGRLFSFMWGILNNERGDVGDLDPPDPGTPEPEPDPGGPDPEPEPEPAPEPDPEPEPEPSPEPEPEPEPDPNEPVPVSRFNKVYGEKKETERKFDQFKRLGADKYYEVYPDEKPADPGPAQATTEEKAPSFSDAANMTITGGPYDGQTLQEVYEVDQMAAIDLYMDYRDGVGAERAAAKVKSDEVSKSLEAEHTAFAEARSKEIFGKDAKDLSEAENVQLHDLMTSIMDQMEDMGVYKLEPAYKLLTMDDALKNARGDSIKALIEKARNSKVTHISTKGGAAKNTGYEGMEGLTEPQLATRLKNMTGVEQQEFWKKAPGSFIAKHQGLADPWVD